MAVNVNAQDPTALDDYSNPGAIIAAICAAAPARCETRFETQKVDRGPVHSSDEGLSPQNKMTHGCKRVHVAYGHVNIQHSGGS